jgi:hypothetical protein
MKRVATAVEVLSAPEAEVGSLPEGRHSARGWRGARPYASPLRGLTTSRTQQKSAVSTSTAHAWSSLILS